MKRHTPLYFLIFCLLAACSPHATPFTPNNPALVGEKTISYQEKKTYAFDAISFDNQFDGARMNDCKELAEGSYEIRILPENTPINSSPWFGFRMVSKQRGPIQITLNYQDVKHRYLPKYSVDGKHWQSIDAETVVLNHDSTEASFSFILESDTSWLAAQEITPSSAVRTWCQQQATHTSVSFANCGASRLGRNIPCLDIAAGEKGKPIFVIISRQHPPEVTGYLAMQSFVERLLKEDALAKAFRDKYRTLVFPLMNPDGVDLGHWRHGAAGVDSNRDWGTYIQPEVRQIADRIVRIAKKSKADVHLGMDFHSTWYDIYYTNDVDPKTQVLGNFSRDWLDQIESRMGEDCCKERASKPSRAMVSKNWFYNQFKAVGITYEIGDETPRDLIKTKGAVSAEEMMRILIKK
ncbi:MAG: M14 family zinc carboxypeptidase [Bacteroidota bacterium]